LIRREIAAEGKSRAFINDLPVSLQVLKQLTTQLLQIHSQYNTLELKSKKYQLTLTDLLLGLDQHRANFSVEFLNFQQLQKEVEILQHALEKDSAQQDYHQFLLEELESLQLDDPKIQQLEQELERYAHSAQLEEAQAALSSLLDDSGPYEQLYARKLLIDKVKRLDPNMQSYAERLDQIIIELKEIARDSQSSSGQELDASQLVVLEALQDKINSAILKHRVRDIHDLIELRTELSNKNQSLEKQELALQARKELLEKKQQHLWAQAKQLHKLRLEGVKELALQLERILHDLKLPHTKLSFELVQSDQLNTSGCTQIDLLFSANLGHNPVPVERAASGGELSRLMLALQKMSSEKRALPTIIFDEIDTGVSGDVALKIGKLLREMSLHGQCMAISHLPQVAASAAHHFLVQKSVVAERMQTRVAQLSAEARIEEIARLLSGEAVTPAAIANANALLKGA
jgi:DNA repair protein RecN (Recombination protein N)